jgi:cbb3-type cytochrome oxidase subunit 3
MSGLAKAFVVINLVLTLFFLGAVATLYQTNKNWKAEAEKGAVALVELKDLAKERTERDAGRILALEENGTRKDNEITLLTTQNQNLENANGTLTTEKTNLSSQLNVLTQQISQKDQHIQEKDAALANKDQEIARLIEEKSAADQEKTEAIRIAQRRSLDLQQQVDAAEALAVDLNKTRKDLEDKTLLLAQIEKTVGSIGISSQIAPKINGVVVAVQEGIVILSVGRDDQVKAGYEFTVYEGSRFVGKVKVETLLDDLSGARILFTEPGMSIQAGQQATTQIAG